MQEWVEKYRPKTLGDIVGNNTAIRQLAGWAVNWKIGVEPVLLYGKPGIGKTSAAYALAADMNWEVVELNASDDRTKGVIDRVAGSAVTTMSLSGAERKLLVLDEADNLHGTSDRGGAKAIIDLVKTSRQPIILIANDIYGVAKELKALCIQIQFRAFQARSIVPRLKYICSLEGINCEENALLKIADESSGDLRSAINMLQAASGGGDVGGSDVATSSKDERSTIFNLVGAAFKETDDKRLLLLSSEIPDTPDTTEQWIEDNLVHIKNPHDRAIAYAYISKADEFLGNTLRRQYYTLWRYTVAIMLIGTAVASRGAGLSDRISSPSRWGKMRSAKRQKDLRNSLFRSFSEKYHIPEDTLRDDMLAPLSIIADRSPVEFAKENNLDRDELDFFLHDKGRSGRVIKEIQKAEKEAAKKVKKVKEQPAPKEIQPQKSPEEDPEKAGEVKKPDRSQSTLFDGF